jgi:molybdopterin/thiamine biosynthesis adenylyltransferase
LKEVVWERIDDQLRLVYDVRDHFLIEDRDGAVEALLALLREGGRTVEELAVGLAAEGRVIPVEDVAAAVALLDSYRLLEDTERLGHLDEGGRERSFSNLAFFESFASLARSREDLQRSLRDAHVLVLGTGGLNANTIPHLCGLGIGRLTLLDRDMVEPRNFARQYLYRWADIGISKVALAADWVRAFDPTVKVDAIDAEVTGPEQVIGLLDRFAPDVVMSGIDQPREVDDWVNDGCVTAGVPYVRAGMYVTQGIVWSVDPGNSACRACTRAAPVELGDERAAFAMSRVNRGIGPAMGLLGALCAFEVLRYLTGFEPPAYAGRPAIVDFADACAIRRDEWLRDPDCPSCGPRGKEVNHEDRDPSS